MRDRSLRASVVICTIRPQALPRVLQALRLQTRADFEVVVVEGPTLESRASESALPADVRRERCPEPNVSRTRNIGIDVAAGDVVAFLDDDAVPHATWLSELLGAYDDERVDGVGGIVFDAHGLWPQWGYPICDRLGRVSFSERIPTPPQLAPGADPFAFFAGCNMSFRRDALIAAGGFDEEFAYGHEDVDMCLRLIDSGAIVRPLACAPVHHYSLPSAVRGSARRLWSDPYPAIKSLAYFASRHARAQLTAEEVTEAIDDQAAGLRRAANAACRAGELTHPELEEFLARLTAGVADGRARAALEPSRITSTAAPAPRTAHGRASQRPQFMPFATARARAQTLGARALRVCLLAPAHGGGGEVPGGVRRVADETSRALAADGHELHVMALVDHEPRVEFADGVWFHDVPLVDLRLRGLAASPVAMELYGAAALYHAVRRLSERAHVDLVVAATWQGAGLICALDPRLATATRLVTPIAMIADLRSADPVAARVRALARLERAVLERSRHIHAASVAILRDTQREHRLQLPRAHVSPLGTADRAGTASERCADAREVEILFVGRLEPRKGVDVLLDAARQLVREHANAVFVIAGPDNPHADGYGERLRASVGADPHLAQRVHFLGAVDDARLWRLYAGADVFCAPSRYESFGNVLVEASMFGKPLVACAAGGMPEVVEDGGNGLLATAGDPASLRACLSTLIRDPAMRARFGRRSRELYELHHSPARVAEHTGRAYREMASVHIAATRADGEPRADAADVLSAIERGLARAIGEICVDDARDPAEVARSLCDARTVPVAFLAEALVDARAGELEVVARLYGAVLSRDPDAEGLSRWSAHLERGGSRLDVLAELASAEEARTRGVPPTLLDDVLAHHRGTLEERSMDTWTLPERDFLRCLHLAVLARAAGAVWVQENLESLASGHSRGEVARQLVASPEAQALGMPTEVL